VVPRLHLAWCWCTPTPACTSDAHYEPNLQAEKQATLQQQRTDEEERLATAMLENFSAEQRRKGEIAELHSRHDVLRE
jgi:hypothetical protein